MRRLPNSQGGRCLNERIFDATRMLEKVHQVCLAQTVWVNIVEIVLASCWNSLLMEPRFANSAQWQRVLLLALWERTWPAGHKHLTASSGRVSRGRTYWMHRMSFSQTEDCNACRRPKWKDWQNIPTVIMPLQSIYIVDAYWWQRAIDWVRVTDAKFVQQNCGGQWACRVCGRTLQINWLYTIKGWRTQRIGNGNEQPFSIAPVSYFLAQF